MALSPQRRPHPHLRIVPREPAEPTPHRRFTSPRWLVFGLAAGPLAWAGSYALSTMLLSRACSPSPPVFIGLSRTQCGELLVAVVGALVALCAGLISWRIFREAARPEEETVWGSIGPVGFWSLGGAFLSFIFFLAIVVSGLAAATLSGICAQV